MCACKKVNTAARFAGFLSFLKEANSARYASDYFRRNGCFFLRGKNNLIRSFIRVYQRRYEERERRVARDESEKHLRLTSGATISRVFAEKSFFDDDRGRERFFFVVGFDREERRCVF